MITIQEMMKQSTSRAARWHLGGLEDWSLLEWAGAMAGEAGEACNAAKKVKRLDQKMLSINEAGRHFTDTDTAKEQVVLEVCDTIFYAILVAARAGVTDLDPYLAKVFNTKSEEYGFPERLRV